MVRDILHELNDDEKNKFEEMQIVTRTGKYEIKEGRSMMVTLNSQAVSHETLTRAYTLKSG